MELSVIDLVINLESHYKIVDICSVNIKYIILKRDEVP